MLIVCNNLDGGFDCGDCLVGYVGIGVTGCTNVDECALDIYNCDVNVICTDNVGGYECICNIGYEGDGMSCIDIDECDGVDCGFGGICTEEEGVKVFGEYICMCVYGGGNNILCMVCVLGSMYCSANGVCVIGYVGDGIVCFDIDECIVIIMLVNDDVCNGFVCLVIFFCCSVWSSDCDDCKKMGNCGVFEMFCMMVFGGFCLLGTFCLGGFMC